MAHLKPNVVRNHNFAAFTGNLPDNWTSVNLNGATAVRSQILRTMPYDHPERRRMTGGIKGKDFVWSGPGSLRLVFTGGAANDSRLRTHATSVLAYPVSPGQRWSFGVRARCSVAGSLGGVRIIARDTAHNDLFHLQPRGGVAYNPQNADGFEWVSGTVTMQHHLSENWKLAGFQADIPMRVRSIAIEISNQSAGTYVMDWGEVIMEEVQFNVTGGEV